MLNYAGLVYKPGLGWVRAGARAAPEAGTAPSDWREDAPRWMRPETPAGRFFDLLSRGGYAAANAALVSGRITRDPVDDPWWGATWEGIKAYGRGWKGTDKTLGAQVFKEAEFAKDWPEWGHQLAGLGLEIGLDPTSYVGVGLAGKAGKGARVAAGASKFGRLTDAGIDLAGLTGKSLAKAQKANRYLAAAMKATGKTAPQVADIYKAGKLSQAQHGLRGISFAGKRIASPTAGYRFAERLPAWLAGGEAGLAAIGQKASKAQSFIDVNVPGLRKAGKEIGEKFTAADTLFRPLGRKAIGARRLGQVTEARFGQQMEPLGKAWRGLVKGADETAVARTFLETYELGPEAGRALGLIHEAAKLDDIAKFADEYRHLWKNMQDVQQVAWKKEGIPMHLLGETGQLDLFGKPELQHLTMFFDRDALVKLNKTPEGQRLVRMLMSLQDPGQFPRQFTGLTHVDVNRIASKDLGGLFGPAFRGMKVDRLLLEDPIQIAAMRGQRVGRVVSGAEFLEGARHFLEPATDAAIARGLVPVDIAGKVGTAQYKLLDGLVGEPFIASEIKRIWNISHDVESMSQLLRCYDTTLSTIRGYALLAPSYHVRNVFSNIWQNFLAGVTDPQAYRKATQFQHAAWKSADDGGAALARFKWATPFGDFDGNQIRQMLFDEDLLGGFMSEWQQELGRLERGRSLGPLRGAQDRALKTNLAFGGLLENNARVSLYLDQIGKGVDPKAAAQHVRHFLFDYTPTGLSHFETTKLRRLTFFYRWTKNNMLLSLEQLAKQPGKYAGIPKVKHAIEGMTAEGSPSEAFLPEWLAEGYAVRVAGGKVPTYFNLQNWLPAMQIAELFEDIDEHHVPGLSWAMGMLAPTISLPVEQAINKSFFFERPIQEYPGERREFLGMQMPPRASHLLRAFRPLSEAHRFTRGQHPGRALSELLVGRVYPYDYQKERRTADWQKRERLGALTGAWKRALRSGNAREAERLKNLILETRRMTRAY